MIKTHIPFLFILSVAGAYSAQAACTDPLGTGKVRYCHQIYSDSDIEVTNVKYSSPEATNGTNKVDLYLDIYKPKSSVDTKKNRPVWIALHAGGGTYKDSQPVGWAKDKAARRGYVGISMEYRGNGDGFTGYEQKLAQSDVFAVIGYVRANAATLGVNPNKIFVMGNSAGAVTAVQAGITANDWENGDDYFKKNGSPDPKMNTAYSSQPQWACYTASVSGSANSAVLKLVDPFDSPNAAYHGMLDATIPYSGAVDTLDTMVAAGIPSTLMSFPDSGHKIGQDDMITSDLVIKLYTEVATGSPCPQSYRNLPSITF